MSVPDSAPSGNGAYAYYKSALAGEAMPCAFVDLDAFDGNVDDIAARSGGRSIRIASKSVRCVALLRRILERNATYRGLMTYNSRETAFLCEQGFDDFLLGYPAWDAKGIASLCSWIKDGKTVRFMVDCVEHVEQLDRVGRDHDTVLHACIDLDMSSSYPGLHFGVRRSGITAPEHALPVAEAAMAASHVKLDALMGYEAQIAGLPDRVPGKQAKNAFVRVLKSRSTKEIRGRRAAVVKALEDAGVAFALVNGGGTGSVETTIKEPYITEVTVGSGFFSPTLFDDYTRFRHQPSVAYAIEITRRPTPHIFTCQGGGYVASGMSGPDKQPKPWLPEGAKLLPLEGGGEVQTPIEYHGGETLALGDPIFMRYSKAGEMCERFNELIAIVGGAVVDRFKTYRGEGQAFG